MRWKNPETAAAWAVALGLVLLVASAPWDRLQSRVPPGVIDPASQRFAVGAFEPQEHGPTHLLHHDDSRSIGFGREGP
jgi:hypothetical protein